MRQVGEVKVAEDSDFTSFQELCEHHDGWKNVYKKHSLHVWTKRNDKSDFKMIKLSVDYAQIPAPVLYDVLHDPSFRSYWDENCIQSYEICCINPNNDIGYYAMKCPSPIKNRDFVMLRSWLAVGSDYFIINHSINHKDLPIKKSFVRGISYLTGYYIKALTEKSCRLYYVSQADPRGRLPTWAVNRATGFFCPKMTKKVFKACLMYDEWKQKQPDPLLKPWVHPEQITLDRLDWSRIGSMEEILNSQPIIDESQLAAPTGADSNMDGDTDSMSSFCASNGSAADLQQVERDALEEKSQDSSGGKDGKKALVAKRTTGKGDGPKSKACDGNFSTAL